MKLKIKFDGKIKNIELPNRATVQDIYKKLSLSTEVYLAKRGNEIIIETESLNNKDNIELIKVISGG